MKQYFRIVGSARYLPAVALTSETLDRQRGLAVGWTERHTGVRVRYRADEPENGITMGVRVIREALASAGLAVSDMELLIDGSLSLQQPIPSNAALLQQALGAEAAGGATMDVHASCMGFVVSLQTVNGLFASGAYRRAVIVCTETPLRGVNWNDPESAHLMGDGAAAVVVEACAPVEGCAFRTQTFGAGAELCRVQGGANRLPPYDFTEAKRALYQFEMDGKGVHKFASRHLPDMVKATLREAGTLLKELHVIPHQASGPAVELVARRLGIAGEHLHVSIADHGNLIAASIPFVLHSVRSTVAPGSRVMLLGTAAGYSQAAAIFTL